MTRTQIENRLATLPSLANVRLWAIIEYVREAIDDHIDAKGVDALVAEAHELYDVYCAPIDVIYVDEKDEPDVIDRPAKWLLAQMIRGAHSLIHTEG